MSEDRARHHAELAEAHIAAEDAAAHAALAAYYASVETNELLRQLLVGRPGLPVPERPRSPGREPSPIPTTPPPPRPGLPPDITMRGPA
jgi:hypothetical protein